MTARLYERALHWAKRNERWLSSAFFVFGFVDHLVTFGVFKLSIEILIFEAYLAFAAVCTIVAHLTAGRAGGKAVRTLAVLAPLFAQLTIGGLLAGFVIFYAKSSVLSVSWPFLILLTVIFFGNEVLRDYREHLVFQTVLFYFSLYALAIFALPVYLGRMGEQVFLLSTALSIGVFVLFLGLLALLEWERLRKTLLPILVSSAVLTGTIVGAYVTDVIPPIPLILRQGGVYHQVAHEGTEYLARGEAARPWYDPRPEVVHHVPGTPLYAYSAIFAPSDFSAGVVHVWQKYDQTSKKWQTQSTIAFTLSGGREEGYRGYSLKYDPQPGKWRVLVQTLTGQTIGKLRFDIVNSSIEPATEQKSL